jgi:hypothetical protein
MTSLEMKTHEHRFLAVTSRWSAGCTDMHSNPQARVADQMPLRESLTFGYGH